MMDGEVLASNLAVGLNSLSSQVLTYMKGEFWVIITHQKKGFGSYFLYGGMVRKCVDVVHIRKNLFALRPPKDEGRRRKKNVQGGVPMKVGRFHHIKHTHQAGNSELKQRLLTGTNTTSLTRLGKVTFVSHTHAHTHTHKTGKPEQLGARARLGPNRYAPKSHWLSGTHV